MASEQIEYCGECKHYEQCRNLALKGRLHGCKLNKESKENK